MSKRKHKNQTRPSRHLVFVYGSLKEGFGNNMVLGNAQKVGDGITAENHFEMFSLGGFPTVYSSGGDQHIKGEVWAVSDRGLASCDILEGHPHLYCRTLQTIKLETGRKIKAWMYLMGPEYRGAYIGKPNSPRVQILEQSGKKIANWTK